MVNVLELKKEIADAIKVSEAIYPSKAVLVPLSTLHTLSYLLDNILSDNAVIVTRCKDCGYKHRDGTCLIHKHPTKPNDFCNLGVDAEFLRQEIGYD